MGYDLSLPLNTALSFLILYYIKGIIWPTGKDHVSSGITDDYRTSYNWRPKEHPDVVVWKRYSPKTLEEFDGKNEKNGMRILLAIKGTVFDVTRGRDFYGPDGPYGNFAGRDASRGMAKQSFDPEMLTPVDQPMDKLADLTPSEIENMNGWIEHFTHKYTVCGELVENDQL